MGIKKEKVKDPMGERMKTFYEDVYRMKLPKRSYVIVRIDGKAFHTYTRGFDRPFSELISRAMIGTTKYLVDNIQGAKLGYVQSDEISILITDFDELTTSAWFDNNIQKIVSVSASMATAHFNRIIYNQLGNYDNLAMFDARAFVIPSRTEVLNYFFWRYRDATRNAINTFAQSKFSQKQLSGKNVATVYEMIKDDYDFGVVSYNKYGGFYSSNYPFVISQKLDGYTDVEDVVGQFIPHNN